MKSLNNFIYRLRNTLETDGYKNYEKVTHLERSERKLNIASSLENTAYEI